MASATASRKAELGATGGGPSGVAGPALRDEREAASGGRAVRRPRAPAQHAAARRSRCAAALLRSVTTRLSSSLTRRIVVLNLGGLVALLVAVPLPQPVPRGPDRRARAEPADAGRDHRRRHRGLGHGRDRRDHGRSREAAAARAGPEPPAPATRMPPSLEFSINPERVGPVLRRLVSPTAHPRPHLRPRRRAAARLARAVAARQHPAPRPAAAPTPASGTLIERTWNAVKRRFGRTDVLPVDDEQRHARRQAFPEVAAAP